MPVQSFSDLLDQLATDPRHAAKFLMLLSGFCFVLLAFGALGLLVLNWAHLTPQEGKFAGVEVHFASNSASEKNAKRSYFFVVAPQGWQQTPVRVRAGDTVEIHAAGSVTIDMWSINCYSTVRDSIDRAIKQAAVGKGRWQEATQAPENFYYVKDYLAVMNKTLEAASKSMPCKGSGSNPIQQIKPLRGWTGPEGYSSSTYLDTAYPGRTNEVISKDSPYGSLLATFRIQSDCSGGQILAFTPECVPTRDDVFFVGKYREPTVASSLSKSAWVGQEERALWLIVNDVWDDKDRAFPEKFYIDNLGFFYVQVDVTPEKS